MKTVSDNFTNRVKSSVKSYKSSILVAWEKEIKDDRKFFTLDGSTLDGGDILWSGNQDIISFMDRYSYTDETEHCDSWTISQKASNYPWGLIQGTATITLNNASGRYSPNSESAIGQYVGLPNRPYQNSARRGRRTN